MLIGALMHAVVFGNVTALIRVSLLGRSACATGAARWLQWKRHQLCSERGHAGGPIRTAACVSGGREPKSKAAAAAAAAAATN